jgi:TonB family protein
MVEFARSFLWGAIALLCLSLPAIAADNAACQQCFSPPGGKPVCAQNAGARPIMATHTIPPYPELSVMTNEDGTSLLTVTIGVDGVPTDVQIANSSGSLRLDEAARDFVKATWRWTPPLKECGPEAPKLRVSIKWDLKDAQDNPSQRMPSITMTKADFPPGALGRHEQGTTVVAMLIAVNGDIARAEVTQGSGFADLDSKALEIAKTRYRWTAAKMGDAPVNTLIYLIVTWPSANAP